jgi:hypothetical protein
MSHTKKLKLKHFSNVGAVLSYVASELISTLQDDLQSSREAGEPASELKDLKNRLADVQRAEPLVVNALEVAETLAQIVPCLENWVDIQDKEDARDYDQKALERAYAVLKRLGNLVPSKP